MDFAVDIGDTGFDRGAAIESQTHPDFRDGTGSTRLSYPHDFSSDFSFHPNEPNLSPAHDTFGHGTLNASIVGGFNNNPGSAFRDSRGFQYGLGVAPFAQIGVSKLFNDRGDFGQNFTYNDFLSAAYRGGARITNNSWGVCSGDSGFCNLYSDECRFFDARVRDADAEAPGNQELIIIFSAGNDGTELPASMSMPAAAKNVIAVGASEELRGNPMAVHWSMAVSGSYSGR
jgi:subtilisin family serine protease